MCIFVYLYIAVKFIFIYLKRERNQKDKIVYLKNLIVPKIMRAMQSYRIFNYVVSFSTKT